MTDRMEEIKRRWYGYRHDFMPSGTHEADMRDINYMVDRITWLEAAVRELAKGVIAVRDLMDESGGVYGLHLNGDQSPWGELIEGGRYECWLRDDSAAEAAISHPLVSELTGEKECGEC